MSRQEIADLVCAFSGVLTVLCNASEAEKAVVYARLGLRFAYQPEHRTVRTEARLSADPQWQFSSVRGGT